MQHINKSFVPGFVKNVRNGLDIKRLLSNCLYIELYMKLSNILLQTGRRETG